MIRCTMHCQKCKLILSNGTRTKESCNWILVLFLWRNARWCHWKYGYTQFVAATIHYVHAQVTTLMFGCSGAQIHDPEVRDEGSGQPRDHDRTSWLPGLPGSIHADNCHGWPSAGDKSKCLWISTYPSRSSEWWSNLSLNAFTVNVNVRHIC